jgi:hypothetical protein
MQRQDPSDTLHGIRMMLLTFLLEHIVFDSVSELCCTHTHTHTHIYQHHTQQPSHLTPSITPASFQISISTSHRPYSPQAQPTGTQRTILGFSLIPLQRSHLSPQIQPMTPRTTSSTLVPLSTPRPRPRGSRAISRRTVKVCILSSANTADLQTLNVHRKATS